MYCKKCGNKIDNDSIFCSYCGTKQSDINSKKNINNNSYNEVNSSEKNKIIVSNNYSESKYDLSYSKETEATLIGVILLIINIVLVIFKPFKFENADDYNQWRFIMYVVSFILRIVITFYVINIARRQNRETTIWGIFAFLLPTIALIIIGQLKKINKNIEIDSSLNNAENSFLLTEKAKTLFQNENYNDCIRFAERALNLNSENNEAADLILQAKLHIPVTQISNNEIQIVYRETRDNLILKIVSYEYKTIGAKVFINDNIAPNGIYEYKIDNRKIVVKNGKIEAITN